MPAYLRLKGVNAKEHPVYQELTRVKQYFGKIQKAENPEVSKPKPKLTVNKDAARRFVLAGRHVISTPAWMDEEKKKHDQEDYERYEAAKKPKKLRRQMKEEKRKSRQQANVDDNPSAT